MPIIATFSTVATDSTNSFTTGSGSDRITSDNTLTLSGTYNAVGGSQKWLGIFIRPLGPPVGSWTFVGFGASAVTSGSGSWSVNTGALADGSYEVGYRWANDASSASNPSRPITSLPTFTVDTLAPPIAFDGGDTVLTPPEILTPQTYTFDSQPGAQVTVTFTRGTTTVTKTAIAGPSGLATVTLSPVELASLGLGTVTVTASAEDVAGNVTPATLLPVTINILCYLAGTRIATPSGEVAVEELRPGDLVLLADGRSLPVRWLGRQQVPLPVARRTQALPVRIQAGALGENLPKRDLLVSPGHALGFGDLLVNAEALVNGTTIRQETDLPWVFTYWHVELTEHALLIAEGMPAESFLDTAETTRFDNWAERPQFPPVQEMRLPRACSRRQVPRRVRELCAERAAALAWAKEEAA